jgi:hypothetical protein
MDAVISQMPSDGAEEWWSTEPPSGAEEWWSTEPQLRSWDVPASSD